MAATGIDPTVDFVFKRLFGTEENRDLLIDFLNAVLQYPAEKQIVSVTILSPIRPKRAEEDKLTIVDILVRDRSDRVIVIEMQMIVAKAFRERLLYYWGVEYVEQIDSGENYTLLQPTVLVSVSLGPMFAGVRYHRRFSIRSEDDDNFCFSDRLEIHTLELSKFHVPAEQIDSAVGRWLYFLKHGEQLDPESMPASLEVPVMHRAVGVLDVISQTERDRIEYRERMKRQRDLLNRDELIFEGGRDQGRDEGREQGIEQGIEQGELIGQVKLLEGLLNDPVTPQAGLRAMSLEALRSRISDLSDRLRSRSPGQDRELPTKEAN